MLVHAHGFCGLIARFVVTIPVQFEGFRTDRVMAVVGSLVRILYIVNVQTMQVLIVRRRHVSVSEVKQYCCTQYLSYL